MISCDSPFYVRQVKGAVDTPWIPVPCGKCLYCRMRKSKHWASRCVAENGMHSDSCFITLTYDEEHIPYSLDKKVLQDFLKRFRKSLEPLRIRYFACGEYGEHDRPGCETGRPHYHILCFGLSKNHEVFKRSALSKLLEGKKGFWATLDSWTDDEGVSLGNVFVGSITPRSCNYVAGYVLKKQRDTFHENKWYLERGFVPPFVLMSRRPGIGGNYVDKYKEKLKFYPYMVLGSQKIGLPRYVEERLYGDDIQHRIEKMRAVKKKLDDERAEARRQGVSYETWLVGQQSQRELNIATKLKLKERKKI